MPISTIYRLAMFLKKLGFIEAKKLGRKRLFSLTSIGKVILLAQKSLLT